MSRLDRRALLVSARTTTDFAESFWKRCKRCSSQEVDVECSEEEPREGGLEEGQLHGAQQDAANLHSAYEILRLA